MSAPRFFLSYARQDDEDGVIRKLFEDVETRVASYLGEDRGGQGFIDVEIEMGSEWPDALLSALCSCDVLVCLMSPRYFRRPFCGQEWWVFNQRISRHAAAHGAKPERILPLLWQEPLGAAYPQMVMDIQHTFDAEPGDEEAAGAFACYQRRGLHYISERVKIAKFDGWYKTMVRAIGRRVVEMIRSEDGFGPLDHAEIPPLREAPNAFLEGEGSSAKGQAKVASTPSASALAGGGESGAIARFAALVGSREQHDSGPRASEAALYAPGDRWGWRPRGGANGQTLGLLATRAAIQAELRPEWIEGEEDLLERLRATELRAEPVVVVVDPWSTQIAEQGPRFDELDRERLANCAVCIVWPDDEQTRQNREALHHALIAEAFHRRYMIGVAFPMHTEVEPGDDPVETMAAALIRLEERLAIRRGPVRRVPLGTVAQLPSVSATRPRHPRVEGGPQRATPGPHPVPQRIPSGPQRVASGPHRAAARAQRPPSGPVSRS